MSVAPLGDNPTAFADWLAARRVVQDSGVGQWVAIDHDEVGVGPGDDAPK